MKILDRHVARSFAGSLATSFSFFVLMYFTLHLFTHLGDLKEARPAFASRGWSPFVGLCRYYAANLPFVAVEAGPFAVLMAGMWTVQRMVKDAETTAAQAAGVSLRRLMAPVLVAGALCSLGLTAVRREGLPRLAVERHRMERLLRGDLQATVGGALIFEDRAGLRLLVARYEPSTRTASGVRIVDRSDLSRAVDASRLTHDGARWVPLDPVVGDASLVARTDLRPEEIEIESRGLRHLLPAELAELQRRHPDRADLEVLRWTQVTYPLSAVVLLLIGLPTVLKRGRQSVYAAAGLCLAVSIVYFATENVLRGVAERDATLPPFVAAWIPPLFFGGVGAALYHEL